MPVPAPAVLRRIVDAATALLEQTVRHAASQTVQAGRRTVTHAELVKAVTPHA